jgi:hypothetical protein
MYRVVVNCETNEEQYIPLTEAEIAEGERLKEISAARYKAEQDAIAAASAARESARAKLAALGLTEAEVAALVK